MKPLRLPLDGRRKLRLSHADSRLAPLLAERGAVGSNRQPAALCQDWQGRKPACGPQAAAISRHGSLSRHRRGPWRRPRACGVRSGVQRLEKPRDFLCCVRSRVQKGAEPQQCTRGSLCHRAITSRCSSSPGEPYLADSGTPTAPTQLAFLVNCGPPGKRAAGAVASTRRAVHVGSFRVCERPPPRTTRAR